MSADKFEFGNQVRHRKRPEWGVGSVVKTEEMTVDGCATQRISIRFPNVGIKTLSVSHAELERVPQENGTSLADQQPSIASLDQMSESGWLAPMAQRKIEEIMTSLAPESRDPFSSLEQRLQLTLQLYRFDRSGRGLIDWAVAQSGLKDALSRFSRQELEQLFDRWAFERDKHLGRLIREARHEPELIRRLLRKAPQSARDAVQRNSALR